MSERTYRILFEHAPVALWDVDLGQVAGAASAMRGLAAPPDAPDAQTWASHLAAHPEALRALAAAVAVRDANRRALSLGPAATDVA
ncbi:MAG TPA: hypothetical protein VNM90_08170, partial [Haliangium sp.]|nr:hypothetical protein [Haliangium sp.]